MDKIENGKDTEFPGGHIVKYNRDEAFRFIFDRPLSGFFSIIRVNNLENKSRNGAMSVLDISAGGLKFQSNLDLPEQADLELLLTFIINADEIDLRGRILWKKKSGSAYMYGFIMNENESLKETIITELKIYRKNNQ